MPISVSANVLKYLHINIVSPVSHFMGPNPCFKACDSLPPVSSSKGTIDTHQTRQQNR